MEYNSWGNLFAPERRRALGPTFIETFPSSLRFREQNLCFPTMRLDTLCLPMEKRFLRFPFGGASGMNRTEGWVGVSCTYEGRLWFLERYCCVVPHQVDGTFKRGFPLCGLSSFAGTIIGEVRNIAVFDALFGKNFTYSIFISQGVIEGNRGNV